MKVGKPTFDQVIRVYLVLVLILGGASAGGFIANAVLQVFGAFIIAFCLTFPRRDPGRDLLPYRWLIISAAILIAVQFIPLPSEFWSLLPGRERIAQGFELLAMPPPWLPISLDPWASLASIVWLTPAVAILLAMIRPDAPSPRVVAPIITAVAIGSIALGAIQRSAGALYLYAITNRGFGVGFFANGNHQATFLLMTLSLWVGYHMSKRSGHTLSAHQKSVASTALFWSVLLLLVIGILATGSLAGLGLLLLVGMITLVAASKRRIPLVPLLATSSLACIAAIAAYLSLDIDTFADNQGVAQQQTRSDFLANTLRAGLDAAPFGTGIGTFKSIYRLYEPLSSVSRTFVNHAHDDYVEIFLETGIIGLILVSIFVVWWGRKLIDLTKRVPGSIAWAAAVAIGVVLAHSWVDYPMRTAAIESLFAVCVALMIKPADKRCTTQKTSNKRQPTEI